MDLNKAAQIAGIVSAIVGSIHLMVYVKDISSRRASAKPSEPIDLAFITRPLKFFAFAFIALAIWWFRLLPSPPPETSAAAHYQKAVEYFEAKKRPQAIAEAKQAVELDPSHKDAHKLLGACYVIDQKFSAAIAAYDKAVEIDPEDMGARLGLATACEADGNRSRAISEYRMVRDHSTKEGERQQARERLNVLGR